MANPIYLDNSATTRPFDEVIDAMADAMANGYFNPSALYGPGLDAERAMAAVREQVTALAGCPGWDVVFTSGGTEANNLALRSVAAGLPVQRRRIVCSMVEHPSVSGTFKALEAAGHPVTWLPVGESGGVDPDLLDDLLEDDVGLVSILHVNNETGAVMPLPQISRAIRRRAPQAVFHADGVQAFGRVPAAVGQWVDLYTVSGHKIHGPKGIGALCARPGLALRPLLAGGGQERGLRPGTENTPGIAGLGCAVGIFLNHGEVFIDTLRALKARLLAALTAQAPDILVNGPSPEQSAPHILNVSFPGVKAEVLLHGLEEQGVYVGTGSACSSKKGEGSPILRAMGLSPARLEGAVRLSLSPLNTPEQMDRAAQAAGTLARRLRKFGRKR